MTTGMIKAMVAGGFLLVLLTEATVFIIDRRWSLAASAAAVVVFAMVLRDSFVGAGSRHAGEPATDDALESLQRWRSKTEATIRWADSSRASWDRYLRPRLAREFIQATRITDPAALAATGAMVFGEELWPWVDPQQTSWAGREQPGPGRDALEEILWRLEQL